MSSSTVSTSSTANGKFSQARPRLCETLSVLLIVLVIKLLYILWRPESLPLWGDAATFVRMARLGEFGYAHPSGYPIFLRACFAVFGQESSLQIALVQRLLGAATGFIIYRIARTQLQIAPIFAILAGALYCCSPVINIVERGMLAESSAALLLAFYVLAMMAYVNRSSIVVAAVAGVIAALLPMVRSVFLFAGPLTALMILVVELRLRPRNLRRTAMGLLCAAAAWSTVYLPYGMAYSAYFRGGALVSPLNNTMMGGWFLWNRAIPLAEERDLADLPWGPELFESVAAHRDKPFFELLADPLSPTNTFLENYGIGGHGNDHGDRILAHSAGHVIKMHPLAFAKIVLSSAYYYLAHPVPGYMEVYGPPTPAHFAWAGVRPLTALVSLLGIGLYLWRGTRVDACLAILGLFNIGYAVFASIASEFVERYYHPLELTSALLLACVINAAVAFVSKRLGHSADIGGDSKRPRGSG